MSDNNSPLIRFTPEKSSYYNDDSKTKPTSVAGSGKDFKRILSKDERREGDGSSVAKRKTKVGESDDEAQEGIAELEEDEKPTGSVSLFDLSKGSTPTKKTPQNIPDQTLFGMAGKGKPVVDEEEHLADSPSVLFAKNATKAHENVVENPTKIVDKPQEELLTDATPVKPYGSDSSASQGKQTKDNSKFATEQTDLSYVNPLGNASIQTNNVVGSTPAQGVTSVDMQAMIDKLVKEVQVMESNGKTETTIVLKNPPLLEGATITVTAFDHAAKEFNISFENLSQTGQQLLSQQNMRADLLHTLEQKGYNVHILTATTYDENRIYTAGTSESQKDRSRGDDRQSREENPRDNKNKG
jgi:hypothetical protein